MFQNSKALWNLIQARGQKLETFLVLEGYILMVDVKVSYFAQVTANWPIQNFTSVD